MKENRALFCQPSKLVDQGRQRQLFLALGAHSDRRITVPERDRQQRRDQRDRRCRGAAGKRKKLLKLGELASRIVVALDAGGERELLDDGI